MAYLFRGAAQSSLATRAENVSEISNYDTATCEITPLALAAREEIYIQGFNDRGHLNRTFQLVPLEITSITQKHVLLIHS